MQYALLIYSRPGAAEALSADEQEANHREYLDIRQLPGALLDRALPWPAPVPPTRRGPYALQAAIASLQATERLDWPQIAALYGELADRTGSAVVRLNRAVAIAEADGPAAEPTRPGSAA